MNRSMLPFVGFAVGVALKSRLFSGFPSPFGQQARSTASIAAGAIIGLEPSQIERPGSPSMTCWRSKGRSPGFQSDAVWTTR